MPSTLGTVTPNVFLLEVNSSNPHFEFTVKAATSIKKGQPVELFTDGTIQPVTTATYQTTCIGIALQDRVAGDLCTVALFGHSIINAEAKTAMTPGPVFYDSFNGTSLKLVYDDTSVTAANQAGWSIDTASAVGASIRVIQRH